MAELGVTAVIAEGEIAGAKVVAVGGPVPGAAAAVMVDESMVGERLASALAGCLADVGVVAGPVLLVGLTEPAARAATTTLDARGLSASPPLESAGNAPAVIGDWYRQANGDVVGIVAGNDDAANAAVAVLEANAQAVKVPVVAYGGGSDAEGRLADGAQCAGLRPAVRKEARAAAALADALAQGGDVTALTPDRVAIATGEGLPGILVPPAVVHAGDAARGQS